MAVFCTGAVVPKNSRSITITGSGIHMDGSTAHTLASVTVDGVEYVSATKVEVSKGAVITLYVKNGGTKTSSASIIVDGATVATTSEGGEASYNYTVPSDATIALATSGTQGTNVGTIYGTITVTPLEV